MEASEFADQGAIEGDAQPADDGYGGARPPDLSDALGQANQRLGDLEQQPYEQPYEPDDELDYEDGYPAAEPTADEAFEQLVDQRIQDRLEPILEAQEMERRAEEIRGVLAEFPALREPELLEPTAAALEQLAETYQDPSLRTDPGLVRIFGLAAMAEQVLAQQAAGPDEPRQPTSPVETGAGPGAAPAQVDPVERAYAEAFAGSQTDPYGLGPAQ